MVSLHWKGVSVTCSTVEEAVQVYVGLRKIHEGEEPKKTKMVDVTKVKKAANAVAEKIVAIAGGR